MSQAAAPAALKNANRNFLNFNRFKSYYFYFHCGEGLKAGQMHLNMWLPLLLSYRLPFLLLLRDKKLFDWAAANYTELDVVYAKSGGDVSDVVNMNLKVPLALYSSSTGNNLNLVRFEHIRHCFIGHGDSDKGASAHKGLRIYDEIWVAGQAHIDRFKNKPWNSEGLRFVKVGRPGLLHLLGQERRELEPRQKKALYLPTWEGINESNDYSSLHFLQDALSYASHALAGAHVKLHPLTGQRDSSLRGAELALRQVCQEKNKMAVLPSSLALLDVIADYDFFICDISSVVTDCLALNVPIFLHDPGIEGVDLSPSSMDFDDYCYVFKDLHEFKVQFDRVVAGDDFKSKGRELALQYFLSPNEVKAAAFESLIKGRSA